MDCWSKGAGSWLSLAQHLVYIALLAWATPKRSKSRGRGGARKMGRQKDDPRWGWDERKTGGFWSDVAFSALYEVGALPPARRAETKLKVGN